MKNKTVFQVGQKVFDYPYGWGEVQQVVDDSVKFRVGVKFADHFEVYTSNGASTEDGNPVLSFTEYTLEGFSQEPPIDYNDYIGKWGMFWGEGAKNRLLAKLRDVKNGDEICFETDTSKVYDRFQPLTDEQIKDLGL